MVSELMEARRDCSPGDSTCLVTAGSASTEWVMDAEDGPLTVGAAVVVVVVEGVVDLRVDAVSLGAAVVLTSSSISFSVLTSFLVGLVVVVLLGATGTTGKRESEMLGRSFRELGGISHLSVSGSPWCSDAA